MTFDYVVIGNVVLTIILKYDIYVYLTSYSNFSKFMHPISLSTPLWYLACYGISNCDFSWFSPAANRITWIVVAFCIFSYATEIICFAAVQELIENMSPGRKVNGEREVEIEEGTKFPTSGSPYTTCQKKMEIEGDANKKQHMPPASVMTRLILIMVWRKLIRNPNTYSSLLGLTWSLISFRYYQDSPCFVFVSYLLVPKFQSMKKHPLSSLDEVFLHHPSHAWCSKRGGKKKKKVCLFLSLC